MLAVSKLWVFAKILMEKEKKKESASLIVFSHLVYQLKIVIFDRTYRERILLGNK